MSEVYLLGAGFSRSIHRAMPLVTDLSERLRHFETVGYSSEVGQLMAKDFEQALSYLAEYKPWLSEADNLQHRAVLSGMTRNIGFEIGKCQAEGLKAMAAGECNWALPLIEYWHTTQAVVITLNYDVLVEALTCLFRQPPRGYNGYKQLYPRTLMPAHMRVGLSSFASYGDYEPSFSLLKLHGSVNWYRSENSDARSDNIYFVDGGEVPTTPMGEPLPIVSDKIPFIVPPVPNKASLVYHDTLRAMWRNAAAAIKRASKIVVMGYSMPANDVLLMQLIRSNLFNRRPAIELVNRDNLTDKVNAIFAGESSKVLQTFHGERCIREYIENKAYLQSVTAGN